MTHAGVAAAAVASLLLLADCGGDLPRAARAASYNVQPGYIEPTPQRTGDPQAGYRALVNEPYVSCGLPLQAWRRVVPDFTADDLLPGRESASASLPYAFTAHRNADGVDLVVSNCLTCHAARWQGELVVGLGNESLDFTGDPQDAVDTAGVYVRGEAATRAYNHFADRIAGIAPYIRTRTIGVNPATNLTWALMAHRDPVTLAWSDTALIEPPPREPLPVSVPPWWRMADKHAMFYTGLGRGDHARFMLMAAMLCADSVPEVKAVDQYAADIRAYILSLSPPRWPFALDPALAAQGREVFEARCARCHGRYGEQAQYPNLLVSLDEVGTDAAYALAATDGSEQRFYDWTARSFYGERAVTSPARGYVAPPLHGVWATAPYLHNGSVPSIAVLLDSPRRPTYWARKSFANDDYDPRSLGWAFDAWAAGEQPDEERVYDTTRHGHGNGGHRFGDALRAAEQRAVLEYLKTL